MPTKIVTNIDTSNDIAEVGFSGFKNRLINPLFQIDIEGNAGGVTTSSMHVVEGWVLSHSSDVTTLTTSRVTGNSVPYSLKTTVTTGSDTSIAAGQYAFYSTVIEGYDIADALWGTANAKSIWISGRIKAPTTGVYCVAARNAGTRSYIFEVNCIANTWVDFEKEIPGETSGTWNSTNGVGLYVSFSIAEGSNGQTTANSWQTGSYRATTNQANGLATNGNTYEIEDIRVSVGKPIKTEYRPYALDLSHCERYYEKKGYQILGWFYVSNGAYGYGSVVFSTPKRSSPAISLSESVNVGVSTLTLDENSSKGFSVRYQGTTTVGGTIYGIFSWTANARLL